MQAHTTRRHARDIAIVSDTVMKKAERTHLRLRTIKQLPRTKKNKEQTIVFMKLL